MNTVITKRLKILTWFDGILRNTRHEKVVKKKTCMLYSGRLIKRVKLTSYIQRHTVAIITNVRCKRKLALCQMEFKSSPKRCNHTEYLCLYVCANKFSWLFHTVTYLIHLCGRDYFTYFNNLLIQQIIDNVNVCDRLITILKLKAYSSKG